MESDGNRLGRWWSGLDRTQKTIVVATGCILVLLIVISFVWLGTDYSGAGEWILRLLGRAD